MKTKLFTGFLALLFSWTIAFGQNDNKSSEKQSSSATNMEMNHGSANSGCCMTKNDKTEKTGSACGMKSEKETTKMTGTKNEKKEGIITYTCSMHPEVIADKPGKCPKCGMALIEKK
jgi:hypothetical protein